MFLNTNIYREELPADGDPGGNLPGEPDDPNPGDGDPNPDVGWREAIANGDEKKLNVLNRYTDESKFYEAHFDLYNKNRQKQENARFPFDGSDEDKAAWRKNNGLPDSANDYTHDLGDGFIFGEQDQPTVDLVKGLAHEFGLSQDQANLALKKVSEQITSQNDEFAVSQRELEQQTEDALRDVWGSDYRPNVNAVENMLNSRMSQENSEVIDQILQGAKTNQAFYQFLADVALDLNPAVTLTGLPNTSSETVAERKAELETMMGNHHGPYWKGPKSKMLQDEYTKILEIEARNK